MSVFDALRTGGGMHCDFVVHFNQPHCVTKPNGYSYTVNGGRPGLGAWGEVSPSGLIQRSCLYFGVCDMQEGPRLFTAYSSLGQAATACAADHQTSLT